MQASAFPLKGLKFIIDFDQCVNALLQASAFPRAKEEYDKVQSCVNALLQASAFPRAKEALYEYTHCVNALLQASAFPQFYRDFYLYSNLCVLMLFCKLLLFHGSQISDELLDCLVC